MDKPRLKIIARNGEGGQIYVATDQFQNFYTIRIENNTWSFVKWNLSDPGTVNK